MPTVDKAMTVPGANVRGIESPEAAIATLDAAMRADSGVPSQKDDDDSVGTQSIDYATMTHRWALVNDLRGGTLRMREKADTWLPSEEKESTKKYNVRKSRAFLYNAYTEGVDRLAVRPFARPMNTIGDLPDNLKVLFKNADRTGQTLTRQGEEFLSDAIHYGLSHLLVDFSKMPAGANLAEEREKGARPAFIHIPATSMIGWRVEQNETGTPFLTEIRYEEQTVAYIGRYKEEVRRRIRVYRPNDWELWELRKTQEPNEAERWFLIEAGEHTFGSIPLVTLYTDRTGFMMARPALEDLAWVNLAHFQSTSEQRNMLRFARIGILFGAGFSEEEVQKGFHLAPNTVITSTNPEATLQYVEHQGAAMEIGAADLEHLERQMDILSLKPLVLPTSGTISATGQSIEESKSQSALQAWVRATEMVYTQAFEIAAQWTGTSLPDDFQIDIFNDFAISPRVRDDVLALLEARTLGEISRKTLLEELQRRALIAEYRDIDEEIKEAKKDGPPKTGASQMPGVGGTGFNIRDADNAGDPSGDRDSNSRLQDRDNDPNANLAGSPRP